MPESILLVFNIIYKSIISTTTALNVNTKLAYGSSNLSANISAISDTVTDSIPMPMAAKIVDTDASPK